MAMSEIEEMRNTLRELFFDFRLIVTTTRAANAAHNKIEHGLTQATQRHRIEEAEPQSIEAQRSG